MTSVIVWSLSFQYWEVFVKWLDEVKLGWHELVRELLFPKSKGWQRLKLYYTVRYEEDVIVDGCTISQT